MKFKRTNKVGKFEVNKVKNKVALSKKCGSGRDLSTLPLMERRSGQLVTASDFGSNGPRFESGRGRCVESLDKALYSHCPKEKPSH